MSVFNQNQIKANTTDAEYSEAITADNASNEAGMYGAVGANALTQGTMGAVSSVFNGTASVGEKWYTLAKGGSSNPFGSGSGSGFATSEFNGGS
jgi:hypothetical protein